MAKRKKITKKALKRKKDTQNTKENLIFIFQVFFFKQIPCFFQQEIYVCIKKYQQVCFIFFSKYFLQRCFNMNFFMKAKEDILIIRERACKIRNDKKSLQK